MTSTDDRLMKSLAHVDPARSEQAPAKGSIRYESILEAAMTTATTHDQRSTAPHARPTSRRRGRQMALAAAALVVAAAVSAGILLPGHESSAAAAVQTAASNTGAATSLRASVSVRYSNGSSSSTLGEMNGADVRIQTRSLSADGSAGSETVTIVGDKMWTTAGGKTTFQPVGPNDRLATLTGASESVLAAALKSAQVSDLGPETIDESKATHYRIELDASSRAALAKLTPGELAWFELEYPADAETIDVWVADRLVRRIQVKSKDSTSATKLFDFGADVTIAAPTH
ncbi:MAG: hypothetical protein WBQ14_00840 [Gaiellaceae bacterium]